MRITKEDIKIRFNEYNKSYFGDILLPCKYSLHKERHSPLGTYTYTIKNGKVQGHIWIAYNVDWAEENLRETIIHEMIHHYVRTIEGHKGGLFGHNWRFKRQCKRLKKEYGLVINRFSCNIYRIGEKEPTNLFQKTRRFLGV